MLREKLTEAVENLDPRERYIVDYADAPPEEPPGVRPRSNGLLVVP